MIVRVTEIDPIPAMQACMDGYEVVSPYKMVFKQARKKTSTLTFFKTLTLS